MARNLARSSSGTVGSSARARTRALKSIQDSSRLKNRSGRVARRSEEHTSELQSLMCISYAVFCLKKKTHSTHIKYHYNNGHHIADNISTHTLAINLHIH